MTTVNSTRRSTAVSGHAVLAVGAVLIAVPFASILLAAFQPPGSSVSGMSWPSHLYFGNFSHAWSSAGFGRLILSSVIVLIGVVPVTLVLATLAGYGLAVVRPAGSRALTWLFVSGLILPVEVIVVPLYYDLRTMGLANSYWGLMLAEIGLFLPFGVFWMSTHFAGLPRELVEAAQIDGASHLTILCRILLPVSWPAVKTLGVLTFMWCWNSFLLVLILMQDPDKRTAPVGLGYFVGAHITDIPSLAAGTLIVIAPVFLVYLALQRNFISGLLQGTVKG